MIDGQKVFANLGCGKPGSGHRISIFEGWRELRVDIAEEVNPDVLADFTDMSPIPSNAVEGVWCSHALEHLFQHEVPVALAEIYRILSPDGFACIRVPDLQSIAGYIANDQMHEPIYRSSAGPITAHDVVFGYGPEIASGAVHMAHRCGFTPTVLTQVLNEAPFGEFVVFRLPILELVVLAHKTGWRSPADRDALIRTIQS